MRKKSLGRSLALTAHLLRLVLEEELREFDITPAQFGILNALYETGESVSGRALALSLSLRPQTVNEMLRPLEKRNLIARTPSSQNGRIIETSITARGEAVRRSCLPRLRAIERSMSSGIDSDDVRRVIETLATFRKNLDLIAKLQVGAEK
jgi:DNA-binding MarR family transcriptional regulator